MLVNPTVNVFCVITPILTIFFYSFSGKQFFYVPRQGDGVRKTDFERIELEIKLSEFCRGNVTFHV